MQMKKKKTWILAAVVILVLAAALLWFFSRKESGKTLNAGVRTDIGDWAFYDKTHETCYGIEADVAACLAQALGCSAIRYFPVGSINDFTALDAGSIDCLVCAYPSDAAGDADHLFSDPYFESGSYLLVETSTLFTSAEELAGKKIGVISSDLFSQNQLLSAMASLGLRPPVLVPVDDYHQLPYLLETGEVSAACVPEGIAYTLLTEEIVPLADVGRQGVCVAVRKDDPNAPEILNAMNKLIADGTIYEVLKLWEWAR